MNCCIRWYFVYKVKKNIEMVHKCLETGDKFLHEIHLWLSEFAYSDWGLFTENKERKFKKMKDLKYTNKKGQDKACIQHNMEVLNICIEEQLLINYDVIKNLVLLKIKNMMDINVDLLQWFMNLFIKIFKWCFYTCR